MSCIYKYKGQKYSEEQFKEYFINNKQEFVTSIAKNKNVIDSFKRKMEGIDGVFKDSPELASIGTKTQYMQYLSTIFKTSKVKDIVYHGSNQKINQFEIKKEPLIHFGTKNAAKQRGSVLHPVLLNVKDLQTIKDGMWFLGTDEGGLLKELLDRNILTIEEVRSINEVRNKAIEQSHYFYEDYRMAIPEGTIAGAKKLQEILKNRNIGFEYINLSEDKGSTSYAVPSQEQIHILGSQKDIQGFKNWVFSGKPEVNYQLKAVNILQSDKAQEVFNKGRKNLWSLDKILTELGIPKEQKELIKQIEQDFIQKQFAIYNEPIQYALELASKYSYSVEINVGKAEFKRKAIDQLTGEEYLDDSEATGENSSYYSYLTVPGGTNYTENEISTPLITPSIKGHAQFSTDNGIGWFRSDEQAKTLRTPAKNISEVPNSFVGVNNYIISKQDNGWLIEHHDQADEIETNENEILEMYNYGSQNYDFVKNPKTRRILEVQSDIFQKSRDIKSPDEIINELKKSGELQIKCD